VKKKATFLFCLRLLGLGKRRCRAMANYVMGLASTPNLPHPVWLTDSPFNHYTYSNLAKVASFWELGDEEFLGLVKDYLPPQRVLSNGAQFHALAHDFTKMAKPHSHTLEGRGFLVQANPVAGNMSLTAGLPMSVLHARAGQGGHAPPLLMQVVDVMGDKNASVLAQVAAVMAHMGMPYRGSLTLLAADAWYGKAKLISPLHKHAGLVGILRLRSGMKVWTRHDGPQKGGGAPRIYGERHYLHDGSRTQTSKGKALASVQVGLDALPPDEETTFQRTMRNGREVRVTLRRWDDMMLRSKQQANMKDKPIDIVRAVVVGTGTGDLVFARPMFIAVTGARKSDVPLVDVYEEYLGRFDVEGVYRFGNQNLMMDKFQSPDIKHQKAWLRMVQLTFWLLYVGSQELGSIDCPEWQKYLPANKDKGKTAIGNGEVTMAQAQKSMASIFYGFDKTPFLPQISQKGKGRQKGVTFPKRERCAIIKKGKKSTPKSREEIKI